MEILSVIPFMMGLLITTAVASVLAPAMAAGRLARNAAIGIKTRHTMSSDTAWLRGHAAGAPALRTSAVLGWALLLVAAALCALHLAEWAFAVTAVGYAAVLILSLVATSKANAAAKALAASHAADGSQTS